MKIEISFDIELDESVVSKLDSTMHCGADSREANLNKYAKAAFCEYTYMTAGDKVFTRFTDLQEYRLYLLVKNYFEGLIPSDQMVASFFHIPYTRAQSLTRSMVSRYRNELDSAMCDTAREILSKAQEGEDDRVKGRIVPIRNGNMLEELNDVIASKGSDNKPITKQKNTMSNYIIPESSFELLCDHYRLDVDGE